MKRIILCMLVCILMLAWTGVNAETCLHEHVDTLVTKVVEPRVAGHALMERTVRICLDCREKTQKQEYENFVGHVFWMAESLHFSEEGMHLCVFICEECMYIIYREYECDGERQCLIYSAQEGEIPPVQYLDSMVTWKEANPDEEIIRRWLARDEQK